MEEVRTQEEVRTEERTEQKRGFLRMPRYYLGRVRQPKLAERCNICKKKIKNVAVVFDSARSYTVGFECMNQLDMTAFDKSRARNDLKKLKNIISFLEKECRLIVLYGPDCYMYEEFDVEILRQFVYKSMCKDYKYTCSLGVLEDIVKDLNVQVYDVNSDFQFIEFLRKVMKNVNPKVTIIDLGRVDKQKRERKEMLKQIFG